MYYDCHIFFSFDKQSNPKTGDNFWGGLLTMTGNSKLKDNAPEVIQHQHHGIHFPIKCSTLLTFKVAEAVLLSKLDLLDQVLEQKSYQISPKLSHKPVVSKEEKSFIFQFLNKEDCSVDVHLHFVPIDLLDFDQITPEQFLTKKSPVVRNYAKKL